MGVVNLNFMKSFIKQSTQADSKIGQSSNAPNFSAENTTDSLSAFKITSIGGRDSLTDTYFGVDNPFLKADVSLGYSLANFNFDDYSSMKATNSFKMDRATVDSLSSIMSLGRSSGMEMAKAAHAEGNMSSLSLGLGGISLMNMSQETKDASMGDFMKITKSYYA